MKQKIILLRKNRAFANRTDILGFIKADIKKFTIKHAPPYSGGGPFHERCFKYVVINKKRWPITERIFWNSEVNRYQSYFTVLLRYRDILPEKYEYCRELLKL